MKNIFKLFLTTSAFFISDNAIGNNREQNEDYEVYVNQIIDAFSKDMKMEFGLMCCGFGGRMPYDVEEIAIKFETHQRATIEDARKLEVQVTEKFIQKINSHNKIRPFLREYPFKANRAKVAISFIGPDNTLNKDGSVAYVFQVKNTIFYNADKEDAPELIDLMEEPYEEALKIVTGSTNISQSDQKNETKTSNPSGTLIIETTSKEALKTQIDELKTKYQFYGGKPS